MPTVYVAGPLGFTEASRLFYGDVLLPSLRNSGFEILDPWAGGAAIEAAVAIPDHDERVAALRRANDAVGRANAEMIEASDGVFAVLDGTDVDSGTAAEVGYAAALGRPIVGWRSDLRRAGDNEGAFVNLQVEHFIERTGGRIAATLDDALAALAALLDPSRRVLRRGMDFLAAIRRDSDRFYELAKGADPERRITSCPDWTVADLVWHLGEVHWFWATDVELRATDPGIIEADKPSRPSAYDDLVSFGRAQATRLVQVLGDTSDDVAVWTWALADADHTVAFVRRHQVQEAAVHRWDLEDALTGAGAPIEAEAAADSVDEMLAVTLPWGVRADKPLAGTVHLHCTDTEGEWFIAADGQVERTHAKGDVAVRGTASDLLLGLYARMPLAELDVIGDAALAQELLERIGTD